MTSYGSLERKEPSRSSFLGQAMMTLVILGSIGALIVSQAEPGTTSDQEERPFSQATRDDVLSPVWSVAFAPGDTHLACVLVNGDVWLKDQTSGQSVRLHRGLVGSTRSLAFSPDSRVLAMVGNDAEVRLWDVTTGTERPSIEVGGEPARWVAFSPDGTMLAVGQAMDASDRGAATLWDWDRRHRLATFDGHRGGVSALAFLPGRALLAVTGSVGRVRLWDVTTGRERTSAPPRESESKTERVSSAFSPDGALLATAGVFENQVRLRDSVSGAPRGTIPVSPRGVYALAFSRDGSMLAIAKADGTAALWDVATARELGSVRGQSRLSHSLAFSHDGRQLAVGGSDGTVQLHDVSRAIAGK